MPLGKMAEDPKLHRELVNKASKKVTGHKLIMK